MEARSAPTIPRYEHHDYSSTTSALLIDPRFRRLPSLPTDLVLNGLPAPLLGNLLGDSLLVHTSVHNGPGDLSGVLPLEEEGLGLGVDEPEDLCDDEGKVISPVKQWWSQPGKAR